MILKNVLYCSINVMKLCFVFQCDGTLLATGSYDGYARIWGTDGKFGLRTLFGDSQI